MTPLEERIAQLSARFAAQAADERHAIAAALKAGDLAALQARAHKLAGSAGMFGHPAIGEAALALEDAAEANGDCRCAAFALCELLDRLAGETAGQK